MLLIPAIDLKDGRCVRLRQGAMASAAVYSDDPESMARHWAAAGARRLHVVDLDGAVAGRPVNQALALAIVGAVEIPVQIGGGIRSMATAAAYLGAGASQVIVGTRAAEDSGFLQTLAKTFPQRVILGLDARDGRLATRGWATPTDIEATRFAADLDVDLFAIVYTDIAKDGMLTGVNAEATRLVAEAAPVPVIASGGVKGLDDLRALKALGLGKQLLGAISGVALYEETLDFRAGQALLDGAA